MKIKLCLILFFSFLFHSCSKNTISDPYSLAPKSFNYKFDNNKMLTKYLKPIIPENLKNKNLSLAELVDIALLNSPLTKKTWTQARFAASQYSKSKSSYFPDVNFDSGYTRERKTFLDAGHKQDINGKKFHPHYQTVVNPEVTLSYIIYDFGKRKSTTESAKSALLYANMTHKREIETVMQMVINKYYTYLYMKESKKAKEENLENSEASLDAARKKLNQGIASLDDYTQAKTKYLQDKINLIAEKNLLEKSYIDLINALGIPSNEKFKIEGFPDNFNVDVITENLNILIKKAQKNRWDLSAAKQNVRYYKEKLKYEKSTEFPTIDSNFEIGRNYYDGGTHEDYHFSAGFKISFPIFKGFYYKNAIKAAKAKWMQAKALLEEVELEVIKDVSISYSDILSAAKSLKCAQEYLKTAKERFDISFKNYQLGIKDILEVLEAQSSLADAKEKEALYKKNWFSAIANLAFATGSLYEKEESYEK